MITLKVLLLQVALVIIFSRLVGLIFRRFHQPQVVGEMLAGIILGPSVLGALAPKLSSTLFPASSLGALSALSQIGLVAFMFLVGLELDHRMLRGKGEAAVLTSHTSIVMPFFLGSLLALFLYPRLSDDSVRFSHFALFLGTAMSVTAFPVLARMLTERRLLGHPVGALALACAAVDDVTAWCILAGVVVMVRASATDLPLWITLGGTLGYVGVMIFGVRHLLRPLSGWFRTAGKITPDLMGLVLLLVIVSAAITEYLGIHALFGAFLLGVVMPRDKEFQEALTARLEDFVVLLLLPLFFAFTGLRTQIGLVNGAVMWGYCGLIILVAVAGKLGGTLVAARASGSSWREAGAVGILMNTRGLMELVVLNIGLDIGVISPALFAMMVLMALTTTLMTTPLLELVLPESRPARRPAAELAAEPVRAS